MRTKAFHILFLVACAAMVPLYAHANGSQSYTTPGTYTFTVPAYGTLTVEVWGAGGGGGGGSAAGGDGQDSAFGGVVGGGGHGGYNWYPSPQPAAGGPGGGSYGGDTNLTGNAGQAWSGSPDWSTGGAGGSGANGGAGGAGGVYWSTSGNPGGAPGGGGGGGGMPCGNCYPSGGGGGGGYSAKTYTSGQLDVGGGVTVVVGVGGSGGAGANWGGPGGAGASGYVSMSWTDPPPTCTVTFDWNPMPYGRGTIIRWSSANATSFSITTLGSVTPNVDGSQTINPPSTTNYGGSVSGLGGSATCPATLTVIPLPTGTITLDTNPIVQGNATMLRWSSSNADLGVYINTIGWVSASGAISVSPSATTDYTMTLYGSGGEAAYPKTLTVTPAPSCTVSFDDNPVLDGAGTTLHYSSVNATTFSINNVGSRTPNTTGSTWVEPSVSTDYTGTASNSGVDYSCPAANGSPPGTLNVACTPVYYCAGQTIRYKDAACDTSRVTTCTPPAFCSAGSSVCLYPPITFTPLGDYTGHLELRPEVVPAGETTRVHWRVENAESCTVTGTNGDSWNGDSSGTPGRESSPIFEPTTFTLHCIGHDGASPPDVTETATVIVLPDFEEQ